jgi:plasmid maintenance system antidote protein VapI
MMEHRTDTKPYVLHGIREELLEQLEMRKWSRHDLARYSGLTPAEIDVLLDNGNTISQKVAEALSKALEKPVEHWLMLGKGKK